MKTAGHTNRIYLLWDMYQGKACQGDLDGSQSQSFSSFIDKKMNIKEIATAPRGSINS